MSYDNQQRIMHRISCKEKEIVNTFVGREVKENNIEATWTHQKSSNSFSKRRGRIQDKGIADAKSQWHEIGYI